MAAVGGCIEASGPFGIPDNFRRLAPRVSGFALDEFCSSFPSMEGWTAEPDGVVLSLVAPAKHGVVCGSGWPLFGGKTGGDGLVFTETQQSEPS